MTTAPAPNQKLRTWRETHGLTRAQMAEALYDTPGGYLLRCDASLIGLWESGHIRWPTPRYQRALHDLTATTPEGLGFTRPPDSPGGPPRCCTPAADPDALAGLITLAAELTQRGHTTRLATSPPHLTLDHPALACPQHIHPGHGWFCWRHPQRPHRPAPFSLRTDPLPRTADRASQLIQVLTLAPSTPVTASPSPLSRPPTRRTPDDPGR